MVGGFVDEQQVDTAGRILALLCDANRTISELARALGISANAVRGHLKRLETEGLVRYCVVRRGVGKPAHEYRLTAEGSLRLSRAYLPFLGALLAVLGERQDPARQEKLLREVGRRLAPARGRDGELKERAQEAVEVLRALGAVCSLMEGRSELWIEGECCPLRAVVPDHPLACKAVEAMLEEYIGVRVRERCDKHDPPRCRLAVAVTGRGDERRKAGNGQ